MQGGASMAEAGTGDGGGGVAETGDAGDGSSRYGGGAGSGPQASHGPALIRTNLAFEILCFLIQIHTSNIKRKTCLR